MRFSRLACLLALLVLGSSGSDPPADPKQPETWNFVGRRGGGTVVGIDKNGVTLSILKSSCGTCATILRPENKLG